MTPNEQLSLLDQNMRGEFWQKLRAGEIVSCPCCERVAKIYKRRVHTGIAVALVKLYKLSLAAPAGAYIHYTKFANSQNDRDFNIARHWGLIEMETTEVGDKKASGNWRLTPGGIQFVAYGATIAKYIRLYDDEPRGFDGDQIKIGEALGDKFSYQELMAAS